MDQMQEPLIITVDGPAGSGKSSICQRVAERIGFTYVNTGALYRSIAYLASMEHIPLEDERGLCKLAESFHQYGQHDPDSGNIHYQGTLLNPYLYTEDLSWKASKIATSAPLREALLPVQREWALKCRHGALLDGRDTGTVVFPGAQLKIFLTASPEQRAYRRKIQLQTNQPSAPEPDLSSLTEDLKRRDQQDSQRETAPLRQAKDAIVLDSSDLTIEQTIEKMAGIIRDQLGIPV
ncbi:MAG: (d)CMP kinase [Deltaproteobacteria bacterium]|nr:(d)CMP kinase [Deltaproteobacteria bacterium]